MKWRARWSRVSSSAANLRQGHQAHRKPGAGRGRLHRERQSMTELSIPFLRRTALAALSAGFLAGATVLTPLPAFARGAPESFADLSEKVTDAVVNISASTTVSEQRNLQIPQLPPGSPFQEFFDDFFKGPN